MLAALLEDFGALRPGVTVEAMLRREFRASGKTPPAEVVAARGWNTEEVACCLAPWPPRPTGRWSWRWATTRLPNALRWVEETGSRSLGSTVSPGGA